MDKQLFKTPEEVEDFSNFFHSLTEEFFSQKQSVTTNSIQITTNSSPLTANIGRKAV